MEPKRRTRRASMRSSNRQTPRQSQYAQGFCWRKRAGAISALPSHMASRCPFAALSARAVSASKPFSSVASVPFYSAPSFVARTFSTSEKLGACAASKPTSSGARPVSRK